MNTSCAADNLWLLIPQYNIYIQASVIRHLCQQINLIIYLHQATLKTQRINI